MYAPEAPAQIAEAGQNERPSAPTLEPSRPIASAEGQGCGAGEIVSTLARRSQSGRIPSSFRVCWWAPGSTWTRRPPERQWAPAVPPGHRGQPHDS